MKKPWLPLVISLISIVLSIIALFFKSPTVSTIPQRGITLNNVVSGKADEMVADFRNDRNYHDGKAAFWLSKLWLDNVCSIIETEHGDGIRVYFAKEIDDQNHRPTGRNTIVIVSTFRIGPDSKSESFSDHEDYYDHTSSFFTSKDTMLFRDSTTDPGALMFNAQPPCRGDCFVGKSTHDNKIRCDQAYKAINNVGKNEKINTYSEWFSLSLLKYLDNNSSVDGIRIYFAKHKRFKETTNNQKHQNRHAFIIFPTSTWNKLYHKDILGCGNLNPFFATTETDGGGNDNGEQCLNNCTGAQLPQ